MVISGKKSTLKAGSALVAIIACFAFAFSYPQEASAFDLFGIHLWGKKDQNDKNADVIGVPKHYKVKVVAAEGAPQAGVKIVKAAS